MGFCTNRAPKAGGFSREGCASNDRHAPQVVRGDVAIPEDDDSADGGRSAQYCALCASAERIHPTMGSRLTHLWAM